MCADGLLDSSSIVGFAEQIPAIWSVPKSQRYDTRWSVFGGPTRQIQLWKRGWSERYQEFTLVSSNSEKRRKSCFAEIG